MSRIFQFCLFGIIFLISACNDNKKTDNTSQKNNNQNNIPILSPDEQYADLFEAVQMAKVFPDGKTFADCSPTGDPAAILDAYRKEKSNPGFDLKAFAMAHFTPPTAHSSNYKADLSRSVSDHINALWPVLTRSADAKSPGTLLPLPNPFVVPGGRFGEVYYWDSYFTMLGLKTAAKQELINNMVDNFAFLIDTYGHIPNGNRSYYLSRSQPPFFSLMTTLADKPEQYLPQLVKEHNFWMDGAATLSPAQPAFRRAVRLADGTVLNRYWDDHAAPRPESYREDVETAEKAAPRPKEDTYRNLKAGAESGWDFSTRWFADGETLATIQTTDILPVDLNCLLWHLEQNIADLYKKSGDAAQAANYTALAEKRAKAIQSLFWNAENSWFMDYNWKSANLCTEPTLAGMFPLYLQHATPVQATAAAAILKAKFLKPGGLVCTLKHSGQQWDAPNGWAPLQWVSIEGLRHYGEKTLATDIATRWADLNTKVYQRTGKMLEKYNVEDISLEGGGGEYPVQDGFGWSNGVLLRLLSEK
jgi:alpha,alpha-trehalase